MILIKKLIEIEQFVPNTLHLLQSKLYKQLGERLYLAFKNILLLESYTTLNDEDNSDSDS